MEKDKKIINMLFNLIYYCFPKNLYLILELLLELLLLWWRGLSTQNESRIYVVGDPPPSVHPYCMASVLQDSFGGKTLVWKKLGEAMEEDYQLEKFWQTTRGWNSALPTLFIVKAGSCLTQIGILSDGGKNTSRISTCWHAFHRGSRSWGLRGWLIHHSSCSHWGSLEAPEWQDTRVGWAWQCIP